MRSNIEIKAVARDPSQIRSRAERLADRREVIEQEDTFFFTPRGRLKLRRLAKDRGELIYYEREDRTGPSRSNFWITETGNPESLKTTLAAALGISGVVRKTRHLFMVGNTRVHLDEVQGLGKFVELEVVLGAGENSEDAERSARKLIEELGISEEDLLDGSYIDLFMDKRTDDGN